jgi:hypothetical protein
VQPQLLVAELAAPLGKSFLRLGEPAVAVVERGPAVLDLLLLPREA